MNKIKQLNYLAISLSKALTPVMQKKLLKQVGGCDRFFNISHKEFKQALRACGIQTYVESRQALLDEAEKTFDICLAKGISILSLIDEKYPLRLKHIYNPPLVIYVKGDLANWKQLNDSKISHLSMVGTRRPSLYSQDFAHQGAFLLAKKGVAIISGLAMGIDTQAHLGALDSGRTLAVLGSGLNRIYPLSNLRLAHEIVEKGGLLLSEYPLGTPPFKYHFPQRNRIISALSDAILMVEAPKKSGALITLRWGLEHGKEIMVMSAPDNNERYEGNRRYIEEGATSISHFSQIEDYFHLPLVLKAKSPNYKQPILNYLCSGPKSLVEMGAFFKQSSADILNSLMPYILAKDVVEAPGNKYYLPWK